METVIANEMTLTFDKKDAMVRMRIHLSTAEHGDETFDLNVHVVGASDLTSGEISEAACMRASAIIQKIHPSTR